MRTVNTETKLLNYYNHVHVVETSSVLGGGIYKFDCNLRFSEVILLKGIYLSFENL